MNKFNATVSKKQAAIAIVEKVRDFFLRDSMPITIGFNKNGDVDYWHDVYGYRDMEIKVFSTDNGDSLGDVDLRDLKYWEENFTHMIDWFYSELISRAIEEHNEMAIDQCEEQVEVVFAMSTQAEDFVAECDSRHKNIQITQGTETLRDSKTGQTPLEKAEPWLWDRAYDIVTLEDDGEDCLIRFEDGSKSQWRGIDGYWSMYRGTRS